MAPSIVPRNILNVQDLQEFKFHEVIVRMLILFRDGVCEKWLNLRNLLLVYQLYSRLVTHGTRTHLLPGGRLG